MKVNELQPNQNASLRVRVCAPGQARTVASKKGYNLQVCSFSIGDETGRVEFSAFGKDVAAMGKNVGKVIDITDGWVKEWNGKLQVSLGKSGTWEVVSDPDFPLTSDIMQLPEIGQEPEEEDTEED